MGRTPLTRYFTWAGGRLGGLLFVCALGGGAIQARAQTCAPVRFDAGLGQLASTWQEYDNQQRRLLRETGLLSVAQIGVQAECFRLGWEASLHHAQGEREYVGNITTGGSIQTSSSIGQTELRLEGRKVIAGVRPEHLSVSDDGVLVEVVVVEPTGADTQIFCKLAGNDINAVVRERHEFHPGESIRLRAQLTYLFDPASGARLA